MPALTAAGLAVACACGAAAAIARAAGSDTARHPGTTHKGGGPPRRGSGGADRLVLAFAVDPTSASPGQVVTFTVTLRESAPRGALGYRLQFGDGSGAQDVPATSCRATPGAPRQQTWTLHHRYQSPGTYRASVLGRASCSSLLTTEALDVTVSAG